MEFLLSFFFLEKKHEADAERTSGRKANKEREEREGKERRGRIRSLPIEDNHGAHGT